MVKYIKNSHVYFLKKLSKEHNIEFIKLDLFPFIIRNSLVLTKAKFNYKKRFIADGRIL